jgi:translation initiation factor IF-2
VGPAGEEAAAGVTAARCARGMREGGRGCAASWAQIGGHRGGELGRGIAGPRREGGKGGGGKAGWAGRPAGPHAKGGRLGQKERKGRGEKRKRFSFF